MDTPDTGSSGLLIANDGWCPDAARYDSPHFNERPAGTRISLLVIHNISLPAGQFGGPHIADLFLNRLDYAAHPSFESLRDLQVSAHFLIRRDGGLLQFVSANRRAWHAGSSCFYGRSGCNDYSIGIELEGSDEVPFEEAQYRALTELSLALAAVYPLTHIVGHEHIAPGRKTDPGPCFDWRRYQRLTQEKFTADSRLALTHAMPSFPFGL
ncbi:1,6-anhydro-N-acetylmuramyl-L-alanine amidase AmpD [Undibacterium sp.]|jgi:AmpD protein|uniref:1,6-anhydro-N-acetylmuramyl-L-alanine amidase AmpD n=1 Tax=Undibacterium sp. TaxID=1914977 RepID=UPI002C133276|nr:1,6-anhydro-N-acetylmuramyl-L-alanine amidase AmpD [Undibacterium sp.]HTD05963.1 1,6-anhydro-N-acetylmuramyl-L-alanine amidase AmpD [Undibacterium sp.]